MAKVEIDEGSGFCFGVVTAINKAEEELAKGGTLYCLGDIVHNSREVERLKAMGLITINHEEFNRLHNAKVLLRAHGPGDARYLVARRKPPYRPPTCCAATRSISTWCALVPGQRSVYHRHDEGNRPLPLGAGDCAKRQDGSVGLLRRCRRVRYGQPAAGTGTGLPKRDGGDRARPDGGLRRRGAGRSIGARFLCDLSFGSAHALDRHRKAAGLRGDGGLLCGTVQPVLQGPGEYLQKAVRILLQNGKAPQTICGIVRNIGREGQAASLLTLAELENTAVDMFTTVYIGNAATRALGG